MSATLPAFTYPLELFAELKAASEAAPEGPWRGKERPGDRPAVLDGEGYPVAKLPDDEEGEDASAFIVAAANFARAYLAHIASQTD